MKKATKFSSAVEFEIERHTTTTFCATLTGVDRSGAPVVETHGVRQKARILSHLTDSIRAAIEHLPVQVLVIFADKDDSPIVIGVVETGIKTKIAEIPAGNTHVKVDGENIEITARSDVEFKCGKSSIKLTKDGKIIIKGTQILSRAAQSNKVKGATVQIN